MKISLVTTSGVSSCREGSTREISPRGHSEFTLSVSPLLLPDAWNHRMPTPMHFYARKNEAISEAWYHAWTKRKEVRAEIINPIETLVRKILHARSHAFETWRTSYDSFITVGLLNIIECTCDNISYVINNFCTVSSLKYRWNYIVGLYHWKYNISLNFFWTRKIFNSIKYLVSS